MTRTIILSTIVAATLMTGLLVGSFPITTAEPFVPCTKAGTSVTIVTDDGIEMTFPIDKYTYSTKSDRKNPPMYMFTFEPDDMLSAKMLLAIQNGQIIDIHFTACKEIVGPDGESLFKKHEVWLKGSTVAESSESPGDDGFPREKVKGTYTTVDRMTTTVPHEGPGS